MAPSAAWNAVWAAVDPGGTFGFQPVTAPDSEANRKVAGAVKTPEVIAKSAVPLNTYPVGAPPGMVTSRPALASGLPLTSPVYTVLRSVPLDETQKAPAGLTATPQPLTRCGSVIGATPDWS